MNYSAVRKKEVYKTIPVINGKEGERERKESVYSAMLKVDCKCGGCAGVGKDIKNNNDNNKTSTATRVKIRSGKNHQWM